MYNFIGEKTFEERLSFILYHFKEKFHNHINLAALLAKADLSLATKRAAATCAG